jgi:hypothetical protein
VQEKLDDKREAGERIDEQEIVQKAEESVQRVVEAIRTGSRRVQEKPQEKRERQGSE